MKTRTHRQTIVKTCLRLRFSFFFFKSRFKLRQIHQTGSSTCDADFLATWIPSWPPPPGEQLQRCTLGYQTPRADDSDKSVWFLPCGLRWIHPRGKRVCHSAPDQTHTHPLIPTGRSSWLQTFFHVLPAFSQIAPKSLWPQQTRAVLLVL